ncbi:MAG: AI-2E family transporter, partial [Bacteriovoracia bacterium]
IIIVAATMTRVAIPLGISYILFLVFRPLLLKLYKLGLSKIWATFLLFITLGVFISVPLVKLVPTIIEESKNFQYYIPQVEKVLREKYSVVKLKIERRTGISISDRLINKVIEYGQLASKNILVATTNFLRSLLEWTLLVPLLLFFIVLDGHTFRHNFLKLVPNNLFERLYFLIYKFNKQLGDYIFAKAVEAAIIGVIITIGLLAMDFPFAWLLGLIAAVTNVVPYLGPFLGFIPALLVALIENQAQTGLGGVVLLYLIANIFDLALVFPILVSKIVNLHPVLVVISVILGSQYWGVIGMVISIPVAAICQLVFLEIYKELYIRGTEEPM